MISMYCNKCYAQSEMGIKKYRATISISRFCFKMETSRRMSKQQFVFASCIRMTSNIDYATKESRWLYNRRMCWKCYELLQVIVIICCQLELIHIWKAEGLKIF